jgi:DNA-binding transcriptional LysR family regulator
MTYRMPPLGTLRAFEAAARLGRMTAAAQELCVTPGAVSRQVRQLEDHLGVALFDGTKVRPTLTPAAQALQPVLTQAFRAMADALQEASATGQGPLDVACFSTFTVKWLLPRLFDFQARHPGIEVRLRTSEAPPGQSPLRSDLTITAEPLPTADRNAPQLSEPLFAEHLGPVMSPRMAERAAGLLHAGADWSEPQWRSMLLRTRTRSNAWAMWWSAVHSEQAGNKGRTGQGGQAHAPPGPEAEGPEFEHYFFTLEAAVRGLGIAVAPWHLVMDDVQAGRLVAPAGFVASGYHYVLQRGTAAAAPRLDLFCAWLHAQAQANPAAPAVAAPPRRA